MKKLKIPVEDGKVWGYYKTNVFENFQKVPPKRDLKIVDDFESKIIEYLRDFTATRDDRGNDTYWFKVDK